MQSNDNKRSGNTDDEAVAKAISNSFDDDDIDELKEDSFYKHTHADSEEDAPIDSSSGEESEEYDLDDDEDVEDDSDDDDDDDMDKKCECLYHICFCCVDVSEIID